MTIDINALKSRWAIVKNALINDDNGVGVFFSVAELDELIAYIEGRHSADGCVVADALSASGVEVLARGRWYNTTENMPDSWQIGLVTDPQAPPVKNMGVPCIVIRTDAAKALEGE